jgi:hypothetical protein
METLNLADIPIPGLSTIDQNATIKKRVMAGSSKAAHQEVKVDSLASSDFSVTAKIPGAFPKARGARQRLAAVDEVGGGDSSWNFVGAPGPSTSSSSIPVKRRSNLITGSSPLSSLSSEDEEPVAVSPKPKPKPVGRRSVAARGKGKAVDTSSHRRNRPPASTMRLRRTAPKDDEDGGRSRGRPPAKAPRYT